MTFNNFDHANPDLPSTLNPQPRKASGADLTVGDLGELALIQWLKPFCAENAIGDDAALMRLKAHHKLVVTTDMLSENVHFSGRTTPPYAVGWRAAASNLADIAAMGAMPIGITVGLGLPGSTRWAWVEDLYRGLKDCLKAYGGAILGGDLCRAIQPNISITALGQVPAAQMIRRSSASPGMTVVVTGPHGASRAGLALLLEELDPISESRDPNDPVSQAQEWIRAHQLPQPRFDALARLRELIVQTGYDTYPTIAGMDSSDGLASTLLQISGASKIGMDIVRSQIPLPPGLSAAVGQETAFEWALHGGEDFELVLCLPPALAEVFTQTSFATAIGTTTDTGIVRLIPTAEHTSGDQITYEGFQHFQRFLCG